MVVNYNSKAARDILYMGQYVLKMGLILFDDSPSLKQATFALLSISHLERVFIAYTLFVAFILTTETSPKAPRPMTRITSKSLFRIRSSRTRVRNGFTHSKNSVTCFSRRKFEWPSSSARSSRPSKSVS